MAAATLLGFLIGFGCRIQEFWHGRRDICFWQLDVVAALHLFAFSRVSDLATGRGRHRLDVFHFLQVAHHTIVGNVPIMR